MHLAVEFAAFEIMPIVEFAEAVGQAESHRAKPNRDPGIQPLAQEENPGFSVRAPHVGPHVQEAVGRNRRGQPARPVAAAPKAHAAHREGDHRHDRGFVSIQIQLERGHRAQLVGIDDEVEKQGPIPVGNEHRAHVCDLRFQRRCSNIVHRRG